MAFPLANRLISVTKTSFSATFVYDGDGNRVKSTINGVTTTFIGNSFEWHTDANDKVRYYDAGGQRIAMRTGNGVDISTLTYLFGDHPSTTLRKFLGSTSLTYKADTGATTTHLYNPGVVGNPISACGTAGAPCRRSTSFLALRTGCTPGSIRMRGVGSLG